MKRLVWLTLVCLVLLLLSQFAQAQAVSGTVLPNMRLYSQGPMAEEGSVKIIIYANMPSDTAIRAFVMDDAGNTSRLVLPGLSASEVTAVCFSVLRGQELWVYSNFGPTKARHYLLKGDPLPTSAELIETVPLGEPTKLYAWGKEFSFPGALLKTKDGGLVFAWYQWISGRRPYGETWIDYGIAYRSPEGVWQTQYPIRVLANGWGGGITYSRMAAAQHPADGSIWLFAKRDSFWNIDALHLTESAAGLNLDWFRQGYISKKYDYANRPDGEFPYLVAVADPYRIVIALGYQGGDRRFFWNLEHTKYVIGSRLRIAQIAADGSRTFVAFNEAWLERTSPFALLLQPEGYTIAYRQINEQLLTKGELWLSNYGGIQWTAPVCLDSPGQVGANVVSSQLTPFFATQMGGGTIGLLDNTHTPAGTVLSNQAEVIWEGGIAQSNLISLTVAQAAGITDTVTVAARSIFNSAVGDAVTINIQALRRGKKR